MLQMGRRSKIAAAVTVGLFASVFGAASAMAVSDSLSVSGASSTNFSINWQTSGVSYSGTLKNTGTTDNNTAYFYAQAAGYPMVQLARATARSSAAILPTTLYDRAATKTTSTSAQVCRDRVMMYQDCNLKTYRR